MDMIILVTRKFHYKLKDSLRTMTWSLSMIPCCLQPLFVTLHLRFLILHYLLPVAAISSPRLSPRIP